MRIVYMGNGWLGYACLNYLSLIRYEEIIGLVIHPEPNLDDSTSLVNLGVRVFDGSIINERNIVQQIRKLKPDLIVCINFGYILGKEIIKIPPKGCINLHTSYLPYNRGANPNIWSIVDRTPAGVTLHYIDEGVDTGDIIAQQKVLITPIDTGQTLYNKLQEAGLDLFKANWPLIRDGTANKIIQPTNFYRINKTKDVEEIDYIDLLEKYRAIDLINILRARTFPPYKGAYFIDEDSRKVYMQLKLEYGEEE
jgi:methionyl-tRNA formyltransferase